MVQKYTYNNKQYVVKIGSRGGSYITVGQDRRKVYIKFGVKGGKGSSSSSSSSSSSASTKDSLLSDEDDDSFFKNYKEKQTC